MALAAAPALTIGGPPRVNLLPRAVTASRQRASLLRRGQSVETVIQRGQ